MYKEIIFVILTFLLLSCNKEKIKPSVEKLTSTVDSSKMRGAACLDGYKFLTYICSDVYNKSKFQKYWTVESYTYDEEGLGGKRVPSLKINPHIKIVYTLHYTYTVYNVMSMPMAIENGSIYSSCGQYLCLYDFLNNNNYVYNIAYYDENVIKYTFSYEDPYLGRWVDVMCVAKSSYGEINYVGCNR